MPRFYCPLPLATGATLDLPSGAARHVQVLRLQPGDSVTLFTGIPDHAGRYGEYPATVTHMGRNSVTVAVGDGVPTQREAARDIHLAVGMPANDRMDWLVEKAAELGVASIQPLMTERSVLRLSGERADKKVAHWHSVAVAACEQCGGNRVPLVHGVQTLAQWLKAQSLCDTSASQRWVLSLRPGSQSLRMASAGLPDTHSATFLSGPEGGLSVAEDDAAVAAGLSPVSLGARVLRAETAALAALAALLV